MIVIFIISTISPPTISIPGHFFIATTLALRVTIAIAPHPDNRAITLLWDSPDGGAGSSFHTIDPDTSRTTFQVRLSPGTYTLQAILTHSTGTVNSRQESITIITPGGQPEG